PVPSERVQPSHDRLLVIRDTSDETQSVFSAAGSESRLIPTNVVAMIIIHSARIPAARHMMIASN
ncbi:MAG TPA: hypothetical protein VF664_06165, partial [Cystobacter sp.]